MADTPKPGETATPATPSNEPSTPGTPAPAPAVPPVKTDDGELEKARKEAEQATLRANQLANELKEKDAAEAARKAKELEEQSEYKTLYEQEKEKREAAEAASAAETKKSALKEASDKVFADYPAEVRELAEETGMQLSDSDEAAIDSFKQKLDKIKAKLPNASVGPNNPKPKEGAKPSMENSDGVIEAPVTGNKFDELVSKMPGIASMMGNTKEPE